MIPSVLNSKPCSVLQPDCRARLPWGSVHKGAYCSAVPRSAHRCRCSGQSLRRGQLHQPRPKLCRASGVQTSPTVPERRWPWTRVALWLQALLRQVGAFLQHLVQRLTGKSSPSQPTQQAETGPSSMGEVDFSTELAGTRVQTALRKAISFKRANDPPRVMAELSKAMAENDKCHAKRLTARYSREEVQELFSFYLQHAEMPAKRAELAQLRELLDLTQTDTASLESAVFGAGDSWMI